MDSSERKYEPISVEMIGLENGVDRFSKDGNVNLPSLAKWRNNLTALSHHYNLFFIAQSDKVAVYEPEFPYQILRNKPVLLISPDLANPHANGYLSSAREGISPHCINHLVVGDLGSQEVLTFVTDSGNVSAYYTSSIAATIKRAASQKDAGTNAELLGLRHFFAHWARQSAWGLDIHKHARMIAVSSNVPNAAQPAADTDSSAAVTVFAFALTADSHGTSSSSDDEDDAVLTGHAGWVDWTEASAGSEPRRDRNYKITLNGSSGQQAHESNIPNITFVNTEDDSEGTWLLSTDITGAMKLWQIWKIACFRTWSFGNPNDRVRPWLHHQFPGWNVAALDVSCFRPARTNDEFIGTNKAPKYYGYEDSGPNYNLTSVVTRLPGNSQFHPHHPEPTDTEEPVETERASAYEDSHSEDELADDMEDVQSPIEPPLVPDFPLIPEKRDRRTPSRDIERYDRAVVYEIETDTDSDGFESDSDEGEGTSIGSRSPQSPTPVRNPRMQNIIRRAVTPLQSNAIAPEIAMVHCSDSHIRLIGSPKANFPHIFSANMLRQLMPHNIHTHAQGLEFVHMDRLNMLHVIKEVGVMLIATQTGRVAVCALTRRPDQLLGLRVDWILPTKQQERSGRRPGLCTLIGMAVAPIQGRAKPTSSGDSDNTSDRYPDEDTIDIDGVRTSFDSKVVVLRHRATVQEYEAWRNKDRVPPTPKTERRKWSNLNETEEWGAYEINRRYRLMLTFSDLSVLTYEISRKPERHEVA